MAKRLIWLQQAMFTLSLLDSVLRYHILSLFT